MARLTCAKLIEESARRADTLVSGMIKYEAWLAYQTHELLVEVAFVAVVAARSALLVRASPEVLFALAVALRTDFSIRDARRALEFAWSVARLAARIARLAFVSESEVCMITLAYAFIE